MEPHEGLSAAQEMLSEPLADPTVFEEPQEPAPDMATSRDRVAGAFAGLASGVTKLAIGHPFDTIKVRCQVEGSHGRFHGPVQCLVNTVRYEGVRALYRGASMPLFGWAIMDAVQLGSLSNYRLILQRHDKNRVLSSLEQGIAGIGAGWTVAMVASPVELVKVRLQMQYVSGAARQYKGPIDCVRQLAQRYGPLGVYRGLHATLAQRSFFFFLWGSYDVYSNWLRSLRLTPQFPYLTTAIPARPNTPAYHEARKAGQLTERAVNFLAGGMAANTFWTLAFPVDVAKNRYMSQVRIHTLVSLTMHCSSSTNLLTVCFLTFSSSLIQLPSHSPKCLAISGKPKVWLGLRVVFGRRSCAVSPQTHQHCLSGKVHHHLSSMAISFKWVAPPSATICTILFVHGLICLISFSLSDEGLCVYIAATMTGYFLSKNPYVTQLER